MLHPQLLRMNRSLKLIIALSLIAVTNMYVDCRKNAPYPEAAAHYYFEPVSITPYQLNYSVGDTVWLHVSLPGKVLYDSVTKQQVRYDSGYFGASAGVQLLYNDPFVSNDSPLVSFVYTQGVSATEGSNGVNTFTSIVFGCNQPTDYDLQFGIVFTHKGVYGIGMNGSLQKCYSTLYVYNQMGYYFTVADAHADYYAQLPFGNINQQENTYTFNSLEAKTMVCVNVQ